MLFRKRWFDAVNRSVVAGNKYCCEDHFSLKNDCTNFFKKLNPRLKRKVVPHLFLSRPNPRVDTTQMESTDSDSDGVEDEEFQFQIHKVMDTAEDPPAENGLDDNEFPWFTTQTIIETKAPDEPNLENIHCHNTDNNSINIESVAIKTEEQFTEEEYTIHCEQSLGAPPYEHVSGKSFPEDLKIMSLTVDSEQLSEAMKSEPIVDVVADERMPDKLDPKVQTFIPCAIVDFVSIDHLPKNNYDSVDRRLISELSSNLRTILHPRKRKKSNNFEKNATSGSTHNSTIIPTVEPLSTTKKTIIKTEISDEPNSDKIHSSNIESVAIKTEELFTEEEYIINCGPSLADQPYAHVSMKLFPEDLQIMPSTVDAASLSQTIKTEQLSEDECTIKSEPIVDVVAGERMPDNSAPKILTCIPSPIVEFVSIEHVPKNNDDSGNRRLIPEVISNLRTVPHPRKRKKSTNLEKNATSGSTHNSTIIPTVEPLGTTKKTISKTEAPDEPNSENIHSCNIESVAIKTEEQFTEEEYTIHYEPSLGGPPYEHVSGKSFPEDPKIMPSTVDAASLSQTIKTKQLSEDECTIKSEPIVDVVADERMPDNLASKVLTFIPSPIVDFVSIKHLPKDNVDSGNRRLNPEVISNLRIVPHPRRRKKSTNVEKIATGGSTHNSTIIPTVDPVSTTTTVDETAALKAEVVRLTNVLERKNRIIELKDRQIKILKEVQRRNVRKIDRMMAYVNDNKGDFQEKKEESAS